MTDGIILTAIGAISLILGFTKNGPSVWMSWYTTGLGKKIFGDAPAKKAVKK